MHRKRKHLYSLILFIYVLHLTVSHANPFQSSLLCIPEQGAVHVDMVMGPDFVSHEFHCNLSVEIAESDEMNSSCKTVEWHQGDDNDWLLNSSRQLIHLLHISEAGTFKIQQTHSLFLSCLQYSNQNTILSHNILIKKTTHLLI